MGRRPCCDKVGLKKGPWTEEEDKKLVDFISKHGHCCWRTVPELAGLARCGKSCRLRWTNYLRPDLKRGVLSEVEEQIIIDLHSTLGNRWSKIASHLPGRTDNEIKNYWNTHIKKKLRRLGIDPLTHGPASTVSTHKPKAPLQQEIQNEMALKNTTQQVLNTNKNATCKSETEETEQDLSKLSPALNVTDNCYAHMSCLQLLGDWWEWTALSENTDNNPQNWTYSDSVITRSSFESSDSDWNSNQLFPQ